MMLGRRAFLAVSAAAFARPLPVAAARPVKAVAFDGLAVFDARPVAAAAEREFPGQGAALIAAWRAGQFEYTWLRSLMGRYADFRTVTDEALTFAARTLKLDLGPDQRRRLMETFLALKAWPDAPAVLRTLLARNVRLALLTNFSPRMIEAATRNAELGGVFEHALSTDRVQVYKPDPRAYRMGVDAFGLSREEILFVAFAGWDAAGARSFGYPTWWVNRLGLPPEELGVAADAVGLDLAGLAEFVAARG